MNHLFHCLFWKWSFGTIRVTNKAFIAQPCLSHDKVIRLVLMVLYAEMLRSIKLDAGLTYQGHITEGASSDRLIERQSV